MSILSPSTVFVSDIPDLFDFPLDLFLYPHRAQDYLEGSHF